MISNPPERRHLREAREALGLTIAEVCREVGLHHGALASIEGRQPTGAGSGSAWVTGLPSVVRVQRFLESRGVVFTFCRDGNSWHIVGGPA